MVSYLVDVALGGQQTLRLVQERVQIVQPLGEAFDLSHVLVLVDGL